jgi:hypothetical protein
MTEARDNPERPVLENFHAHHATYGGWVVSIEGGPLGKRQAAFASFDEMIRWLSAQTRKDAGVNRP